MQSSIVIRPIELVKVDIEEPVPRNYEPAVKVFFADFFVGWTTPKMNVADL